MSISSSQRDANGTRSFRSRKPFCLLVCLFLAAVPLRANSDQDRILVFAAASLADALAEVTVDFEADTGHEVALSFAGSSALARQILLGAPADLFLSADPTWATALQDAGRVEPGKKVALLSNNLVLIGSRAVFPAAEMSDREIPVLTENVDINALLGSGRLAVGLIDAVPAGRYAADALTSLGLWDVVSDRLAQTDNVRAALALVASGAAPVGIVYGTDARADPRVTVLGVFPQTSHAPIIYPLVDLSTRDSAAENAFFEALSRPAAGEIFTHHGFGVLQSEAQQ